MKATRPAVKRLLVVLVVAGVLTGAGFGAYYLDRYVPYWHFRTVEKGAFYRSSQLDAADLAGAIEAYGIRTVVNLRDIAERAEGTWYADEVRVTGEKGVRLVDLPLKAGTPPSPAQVEQLLAVLDDAQNRPVLWHCYHGSIRSAALEGLLRCEYMGESGPEAFEQVESWGRDLEADYPQIARFIRSYLPRRDRE